MDRAARRDPRRTVSAGVEVAPFEIGIAEDRLAWVRGRLRDARWPKAPDGAGRWEYGVDEAELRDLVAYLAEEFDWCDQETVLNALPQFVATVDGRRIHFVHLRADAPDAPTVVLIHGWPGSFLEYVEAAGRLVAAGIDVVIPSQPGYGFSDPPDRVIGPRTVARLFDRLLTDGLGLKSYIAQGGDIGAAVASWLGYEHDACRAVHLNYVAAWFKYDQPGRDDAERAALANRSALLAADGGYAHVQATRFQDLAYALADSPIGATAWLLARFKRDIADLWQVYDRTMLATHIMLYLLTDSIGSSTWIYRGIVGERPTLDMKVAKPCGVAHFPRELAWFPRSFVEASYDLVRWTEMPAGGHFAAMEQPAAFASEVAAFVEQSVSGNQK